MNLEKALKDPASEFDSPDDVLNADLSVEQKRDILSQWKRDAELLAEAAAENMAGGEPNMLHRVAIALGKLDE